MGVCTYLSHMLTVSLSVCTHGSYWVSVLVYQWVFLGVCIYLPHMYSTCRKQFM